MQRKWQRAFSENRQASLFDIKEGALVSKYRQITQQMLALR